MPRTKKKIAKVTEQAVPQKANCEIVLSTAGQNFRAGGATIIEALNNLPKQHMKVKGVLNVRVGTMTTQLRVAPIFMRRLAANRLSQEIFQKRIAISLR